MNYAAFFLLPLIAFESTGQELPHHALSLELGKTGLIANLAYDQLFSKPAVGLRAVAGRSFGRNLQAFTAGAGTYVLFGKRPLFFEAGVDLQYLNVDLVSDDENPGLGLVYPDYPVKTWCPGLNLGLRRYSRNTLFRAGLSGLLINRKFVPGAYAGIGRIF